MGIPRRDGGSGTFQVNIRPLVKTCPEEQGIGLMDVPDGTKLCAMALTLWPNHDRGLVSAVLDYLADKRPEIVLLPGGILNEEAFKQVVQMSDRMRKLVVCSEAPEVCQIRERFPSKEALEDRFLGLAELGGKFIADIAAASGGHVIYIPSSTTAGGQMPNELSLFDFVLSQKEKRDKYVDKHSDEAIEGPPISHDWAEFLGLAGNENITVLPFGGAVRINNLLRVDPSNFKRRQPGAASYVNYEQTGENYLQTGDGKASSWHESKPGHSLGETTRRWVMGHELGGMYDLKQVGFLGNYDRRARSIVVGTIVGGRLHGGTHVPLIGTDGRRSMVIDGRAYDEPAVYARERTFALTVPARDGIKAKAAVKSSEPVSPAASRPTYAKGDKLTVKIVGAGVTSYETDEVIAQKGDTLFTRNHEKQGLKWCDVQRAYHTHGLGLTISVVANDDPAALKYLEKQASSKPKSDKAAGKAKAEKSAPATSAKSTGKSKKPAASKRSTRGSRRTKRS